MAFHILFMLIVAFVILALLIVLNRMSARHRAATWLFLPAAIGNLLFYYVVVRRDFGLFIPSAVDTIDRLSNYRTWAITIPAVIALAVAIRETWKERK